MPLQGLECWSAREWTKASVRPKMPPSDLATQFRGQKKRWWVNRYVYRLESLPAECLEDATIVLEICKQNHNLLPILVRYNSPFARDQTILSTCVWKSLDAMPFIPSGLLDDASFVKALVKRRGKALLHASERLQENSGLVLCAVSNDIDVLEHLPPHWRDEYAVMKKVGMKHDRALEYASERLRCTREFVKEALLYHGEALRFASDEFRSDPSIVLVAIRSNGIALQYALCDIDYDMAVLAVHSNHDAYTFLSDDYKRDYDIVMKYAKKGYLGDIPEELHNNRGIVKRCLEFSGSQLRVVNEDFKRDYEMVMVAIKSDGMAIEFAHESLKKTPSIVLEAMRTSKRRSLSRGRALWFTDELATEVVRNDGLALKYLSQTQRGNPSIVHAAISQNIHAARYMTQGARSSLLVRMMIGDQEDEDNVEIEEVESYVNDVFANLHAIHNLLEASSHASDDNSHGQELLQRIKRVRTAYNAH